MIYSQIFLFFVQNRIMLVLYRSELFLFCIGYLTISPRTWMGSESIAHEAED